MKIFLFELFLFFSLTIPGNIFIPYNVQGGTITFFIPETTTDSNQAVNPRILKTDRLRSIVFLETSGYLTSMVALNELWYKNFSSADFHFFNDNQEWLQVDKIGHITTSYYIGKIGLDALKRSGVSEKKSMLLGGTLGLAFLSSVELMDGYSTGWGASYGDMLSNVAGCSFLLLQEMVWKKQKILLKYSYSPSKYPQYRPSLLGNNLREQLLKDYNGQTYWLSVNPASFSVNNKFPRWLNVALGYGADGMLGGFSNPVNEGANSSPVYQRKRQFYLSLDIDLTRIKTKSGFINSLFNVFGFIKFPAPTLELSGKKLKLHPLYF